MRTELCNDSLDGVNMRLKSLPREGETGRGGEGKKISIIMRVLCTCLMF